MSPEQNQPQDEYTQFLAEEQKFLTQEIEKLDPLLARIRIPIAQRLMSQGGWLIMEAMFYLLAAGLILVAIFLTKLYPFYLLDELVTSRNYIQLGRTVAEDLRVAIYLFIGFMALGSFLCGRLVRNLRYKSSLVHSSGTYWKNNQTQLKKRVTHLENIQKNRGVEAPAEDPGSIPDNPGDQPFPTS